MTPEAADWVYEHALTPAYRDSVGCSERGPVAVRTCPCEWGACASCSWGRHTECPVSALGQVASPAARLCDRAGSVVVDRATGRYAEVWPAGTPCAWRCPCVCPTPEPEPEPAAEPVVEQLDLFALAGGGRG